MSDLNAENGSNDLLKVPDLTTVVQAEAKEQTGENVELSKELITMVTKGDLENSKALVEKGADICYKDEKNGRTTLHYAAENGHASLVEWLLSQRHPYNLVDKHDITAAELARNNGHVDIYERLVNEGVRSELILRALAATMKDENSKVIPNEDYLKQKLHYQDNKLMDANNDAVMMGWEAPLMVEHAKVMCPKEGLDVLNVGFGLGIIDTELQKYKPRNHYIIEAHPDVYAHMKELGWDKKPGVTILFGRWQDMLPTLTTTFDAIFFDTYGEFYDDLYQFHEAVTNILDSDGIYTWFNGLGATNYFFHDIYCRISEIDLHEFGLNTEYVDINAETAFEKGVWDGVRQKYWLLDVYKLPVCRFFT